MMLELDIVSHIVEYSDYYCVNHVIFLPLLENDRREENFPTVVNSSSVDFCSISSRILRVWLIRLVDWIEEAELIP